MTVDIGREDWIASGAITLEQCMIGENTVDGTDR